MPSIESFLGYYSSTDSILESDNIAITLKLSYTVIEKLK